MRYSCIRVFFIFGREIQIDGIGLLCLIFVFSNENLVIVFCLLSFLTQEKLGLKIVKLKLKSVRE